MMQHWQWIALIALAVLVIYLQFRVYQVHRESKKREELFQIVTENAADMIALVDVKGRRLYNSPAYKRVLGYSAAELGETSAFEQIHPDDRFRVLEAAQEARSTGIGRNVEYRIRHKDGSWRVLESVAGTIRDDKGDVVKLVIVNRDITDRKRAQQQAEHNSSHDPLSGLPNRLLFQDRLQSLFDRAQRSPERQYAVLFVDLDGFKVINDTMGPTVGDQVIVEISRRLETCLRDEDTVSRSHEPLPTKNTILSRMGGDEFTILLEGVTNPSDAMRAARRVLSAVTEPLLVQGQEVRISASIGVALSTTNHKRAEELLQEADIAMRRAKALGGSRCEVFDEAMHTQAVNRLKLEKELREAIEKRQFRLYYQPIVRLKTNQVAGFEALLRWQHPEQGLVSAYKFLAAAEDTGLLVSTGHWVILQACQQLRAWDNEIPSLVEAVSISVNISAKQLADPRFIADLSATLLETGIDPSRLHIEITESVATADANLTAAVLPHLKHLRVGVVLDDFGTDSSSLNCLRQFAVEALKVDRSLIGGMLSDRAARDMVELIILLSQKLKFKVIAEGVESTKQLDQLRELGCELGQGYLFSSPLDAKAAEQLLRQGNALPRANVAGAK